MSYYIFLMLSIAAFVIEMMIPSFFALFTGIGFIFGGIIAYFYPDSLFLQLIGVSVFMVLGVIVFKRNKIADVESSKIGRHDEFVGIQGLVKVTVQKQKEGEVEVYEPIVGSRIWPAISVDDEIEVGQKIEIVELQGNTLLVKKTQG